MNGVPVIWIGTTMDGAKPEELEKHLKNLGFTVRFEEEFKDNEGHPNIIFTLLDNLGEFCYFRLHRPDMKWVDDWNDNHPGLLPKEIIRKYIK